MEATADTLLNQVTGILLSKIDKQNLDPDFLQKFVEGLLGRFTYSTSKTIKQKSSTNNQPISDNNLIDNLKKVYKDLLKDNSYKTDYKNFLKDVLPKDLVDKVETTNTEPPTSQNIEQEEGRKNLIKTAPEKQKVIFDGFSERGWAFFSERLPKILKPLMPKLSADKTQGSGGFGLLGPGIALLLGGLAALVAGLMTDGPFKGILKILSKVGLSGAIKMLEGAAKIFIAGFKQIIMAPINLLDDATKLIGKLFGKEAYKAVLKPIRGLTGIFTKMLGGLVKFITPLLKKLPLIGTVISWGFAYSRFKSGDVIGGTIDLLSGIASIFPGVGTAIAIGLDVLNAFLDVKARGANEQTSTKKGNILSGWLKTLGGLIYKGLKNLPVIGPAIKSVEEFSAGNYLKAIKQLAYIATPLEFIGALLGDEEVTGVTKTGAGFVKSIGSMLLSLGKWLAEKLYKVLTNIPIIGPAIRAFEQFSAGNFGKGLKQLAYILPPFEMLGALLGDEEVGGVASGIVSAGKSIGSMLLSLGKWIKETLPKVLRNTFIIGPLIKAIENFNNGNYLNGLKQLAYIFPPFEIIGALLGDTDVTGMASFSGSAIKSVGQVISDLWIWIKDTLWEKISGFVNNVIGGFKDWWNNLSWDPRSWFGETSIEPIPPIEQPKSKPEDLTNEVPFETVVPLTKTINSDVQANNLNSSNGNTSVEQVIDTSNVSLNNSALDQIVNNTKDTNSTLKNLSDALYGLVKVLDKKLSTNNNTTIINTPQGTKQIPSASQVAENNINTIRDIREKFRQVQFS